MGEDGRLETACEPQPGGEEQEVSFCPTFGEPPRVRSGRCSMDWMI